MRNLIKSTALAAMLLAPGAAQAVVYDVTADFSITNGNPNGVWSYGYSATLGGAFNLYDTPFVTAWLKSGEPFLGVYSGLALHPGNDGEYSIFRFTAPSANNYSLNVSFSDGDAPTTDVHVLLNNVSQFTGAIVNDGPAASYSALLALSAGDIIDFAVGYGSNGNYFFDTTAISAMLTTPDAPVTGVPEPMTLSLLGVGLAGLGLVRRRKA